MEERTLEIRNCLDGHNVHHYLDGAFQDASRPLEYHRFAVEAITFEVCQHISRLVFVRDIRLVHNSLLNQMLLEVTTIIES
ncbi:MAG: hypothetical protein IKY67_02700 [Paludibacteraceae bacterium]|nr:hypothetical protein [Paludibacteraceae bacterium]